MPSRSVPRASRALFFVLTLGVAACGDDAPPAEDAGASCATDAECDDGVYCNGAERCEAGACVAGVPPCTGDTVCDETTSSCEGGCAFSPDADGDGARAIECGGDDCDDADPERYPGNLEICDAMGRDEDCDPSTFGFRDLDMDGASDAACCNGEACGNDCDDADSGVNPRSPEVCNGVDDDCDGSVDEDLLLDYWRDADRDGYGSDAADVEVVTACARPAGFADRRGDCDDDAPSVHPAAVETCDAEGVDEDCSGAGNDVPGGCDCTTGASQECGLVGRCAGATQSCVGGRWGACSTLPGEETCNGEDDDCDGATDEGLVVTCYRDADGDGYAAFVASPEERCIDPARMGAPYMGCPVGSTGRVPVAPESSDCDDAAPADTLPIACYEDGDGDGFGAGPVAWQCRCRPDQAPRAGDCCDSSANAYPGQTAYFYQERSCGGWDYNCDGADTLQWGVSECRYGGGADPCYAVPAQGWAPPEPVCGGTGGFASCQPNPFNPYVCEHSPSGGSGGGSVSCR